MLNGEIEVELNPQGTLAERMRAGGRGNSGVLHADRRAARWSRRGKKSANLMGGRMF